MGRGNRLGVLVCAWVWLACHAAWGGVQFKESPVKLAASAGATYAIDLRTLLTGDAVNAAWTASGMPAWLRLDSVGQRLSGTPLAADAGTTSFRLAVHSGEQGALTVVQFTVTAGPQWHGDAIDLGVPRVNEPFRFDLKSAVSNPAGAELTFSATGLPAWMWLDASGTLSGIPTLAHVGPFGGVVLTATSVDGSASAKAHGRVVHTQPGAVKFKSAQFALTAQARKPFSLVLATLVDGALPEACRWVLAGEAPSWLALDAKAGRLHGTAPATGMPSEWRFPISFTCGATGDVAAIVLTVQPNAEPPLYTVKERQVLRGRLAVPLALAGEDVRADVFELVDAADWVVVFSDGEFELRPLRQHLGRHVFRYRVTSEGGTVAAGAFAVVVVRDAQPPVWLENPVRFEGKEGHPFTAALADKAKDLDGGPLTFRKQSGPDWLRLTTDGRLAGTPGAAHVGESSFVVSACSDGVCADAALVVTVRHVPLPPKWIASPIQLPDAFSGVPVRVDLSRFVVNPDGQPLTFRLVSGPAFVTVSPDGILSGTPRKEDVGGSCFVVSVESNGLSASTRVQLKVLATNTSPRWRQNPVAGGEAKEDMHYNMDLSRFVVDDDADPLTFSLVSGPGWVTISSSGILAGTPRHADIGAARLSVKVSDGLSGSDVGEVLLLVQPTNHPPVWLMEPIVFSAVENISFARLLEPYVKDPDGGTLTFQLSGADWLQLSPVGPSLLLSPKSAHVGEHTFSLRACDEQGLCADVKLVVRVVHGNTPPRWSHDPLRLPTAYERRAYSQSVAGEAVDPDAGDRLIFSKISGPGWLSVAVNGQLLGVPTRADVGLNELTLRVTDQNGASADVKVLVEVLKATEGPRWLRDPLPLGDAKVGHAFGFDLKQECVADDGSALSFRKVSGPAWLVVGVDGGAVGVPAREDLGAFRTVFQCTDGKITATVTATGEVK